MGALHVVDTAVSLILTQGPDIDQLVEWPLTDFGQWVMAFLTRPLGDVLPGCSHTLLQ
jgi:hypothetical protein